MNIQSVVLDEILSYSQKLITRMHDTRALFEEYSDKENVRLLNGKCTKDVYNIEEGVYDIPAIERSYQSFMAGYNSGINIKKLVDQLKNQFGK